MVGKLAVAILHYHLRPGGVTRVIERAVEAVGDQVDFLVLTGEAPAPDDALTPITEPFEALGYSEDHHNDFEQVAEDLRFTARSLLGRDPDIWHIHNHALGKNNFMPQLVWHLANAGCRLLLQPHDFAEDGRPKNYQLLRGHLGDALNRILYPLAEHVWYAPINYRDKSFLADIGLSHVHELPNAIAAHSQQEVVRDPTGTKTIVYPARAIRRKNLGEFLLWSVLAPDDYRFQSTLAPQNPQWQKYYNEWVVFAQELDLPVEFDAGRKHDFSQLVQHADALITTSIAEGFGLAFLEPWLEGKSIMGRKLPEITTDFEEEGLDLSALYDTLPVPIEWVGESAFMSTLERAMKQSYQSYGRDWNPIYLEEAISTLMSNGMVDFGILDEPLQRRVLEHLVDHPEDHSKMPPFASLIDSECIGHNRRIVQEHYGIEAYGNRLLNLYQQLAETQPRDVTSVKAGKLLDCFLQPHRFNLLRC